MPEGWEPYLAAPALQAPPNGEAAKLLDEIAGEERELQAQIAEAQRVIAAAGEKLREYVPLKAWIAKNGNGATGQFLMGNDLPVPSAYTAGTKPADLGVPGWRVDQTYPTDQGEDRPIAEPVADDAESGFFDTSDPWHDELEKSR